MGNLLASHPAVVASTAPEHHGIVESHLFDYTRYAIPGRITAEAFVDRYEQEDYFRGLGITRSMFLSGSGAAPVDVIAHFAAMMTIAAQGQDARYWVEKTPRHAIYVDEIRARFPGARFVVVKRNQMRTVRGQIVAFQAPGKSHVRTVIEKSLRYASDARGVERLTQDASAQSLVVKYEDLVSNFEGETSRLLKFLELEPCMLSSKFERYSSSPLGADGAPPWIDRILVPLCAASVRCLPFSVVRQLRAQRDAAHGTNGTFYTRMRPSSGDESEPGT